MNYLGCKRRVLPFLDECLDRYGCARIASVADLFAGTGCVACHMARRPGVTRLLVNDLQAYSMVMLRAKLGRAPSVPSVPSVPPPPRNGFFARHYAGTYFTLENARRIDGWLAALDDPENDHHARARLIEAVARVSNTACVYESHLKHFKRSALSALEVRPHLSEHACGHVRDVTFLSQRAEDIDFEGIPNFDLIYLDPPYNARKYSTNYHIFETIARGDAPALRGRAKIRADAARSAFNSKREVAAALAAVLARCAPSCRYLAVSYNSEGFLTRAQIEAAIVAAGFTNVRVFAEPVRRFGCSATVREYLFMASGKNVGASQNERQGVARG